MEGRREVIYSTASSSSQASIEGSHGNFDFAVLGFFASPLSQHEEAVGCVASGLKRVRRFEVLDFN